MSISKSALRKGKDSIINGYRNASIIEELADCRPFEEKVDSPENYVQIGLRAHVPREWFEVSSDVFLELSSIGRSVATGEENFFINKVEEEIPQNNVTKIEKFTLENAVMAIREVKKKGYQPSALFVPIELYVEMHKWRLTSGRMAIGYPSGPRAFFMLDESTRLRIFWSSKYVPLDKILIIDKSFAKWIIKTEPETGDYIQVAINESRVPNEMEIVARTVVRFVLKKPDAILMLSPAEIPRTEK